MQMTFPQLLVGNPVCYETLSIFPLFNETKGKVDYRLSEEALADQSILIEEVSDSGTVPELLVENKGDYRVLFLEGEELIGAKQNRVLNTSILISAHAKVKIPVSCVEQGRWRYQSRYFHSSRSHSPSKLRMALKASVSQSLKMNQGHRSNQVKVWKEVASLNATHGVVSETSAMSDAFESYQERIASFKENIKYVEGADGLAMAIGDRVVSVDLFDKSSTCQKVWDRLISGAVFDVLEVKETTNPVTIGDIKQLLSVTNDLGWERAPAVGEGDEFRAKSNQGDQASALFYEGTLVHGSVVTAK